MHPLLFLTTALLGFTPSCLSAITIRGLPGNSVRALPSNVRVGTPGIVENDGNITKRSFSDHPSLCYVSSMGMGSWWYIPYYANDEAYACIMGHLSHSSGSCPDDEWWPDEYVEDILAAGKEQITKDGGGETSEKGVFTAQFEGDTTAVSDCESMMATLEAMFKFTLPNCGFVPRACRYRDRHYYFNFKGESIGIVHKNSDCRGLLGFGGDAYEYCPGRGHCKDANSLLLNMNKNTGLRRV